MHQISFDTGEILHEKTWVTIEAFEADFPLRMHRKPRNGSLKIKENPDLWKWFEYSLSIVLHPEEKGERLIFGTHSYMEQDARDILNAVSIVGGIASSLRGGFSIGNSISINPFESMNYFMDAGLYFGEGQTRQGDTYLDLESFEILSEEVGNTQWDDMMAAIAELQTLHKLYSSSLFEYQDNMYLGYWEKKMYYLLKR